MPFSCSHYLSIDLLLYLKTFSFSNLSIFSHRVPRKNRLNVGSSSFLSTNTTFLGFSDYCFTVVKFIWSKYRFFRIFQFSGFASSVKSCKHSVVGMYSLDSLKISGKMFIVFMPSLLHIFILLYSFRKSSRTYYFKFYRIQTTELSDYSCFNRSEYVCLFFFKLEFIFFVFKFLLQESLKSIKGLVSLHDCTIRNGAGVFIFEGLIYW